MEPKPLDHDAPVIALLSIKGNPLVAEMSQEQLTELVIRLRATGKPKFPAKPSKPATTSKAARFKALLDAL
jgi:hypothetical protein